MKNIEIYIDGSCSGNPGPTGWAAITVINGKTLCAKGHCAATTETNNRAELSAAIQGLNALKVPCNVTFYTDSSYLVSCREHDDAWLTENGRNNRDLWLMLIQLANKGKHTYKFVKVAGHAGNKMNELADKYAKAECAKAKHEMMR